MSAKMRTLIVLAVFILMYLFVASIGGIAWMLPLMLVPPLFVLVGRRDILFVIICLLCYSTLRLPMMKGQTQIYHGAVLLYIAIALGSCAAGRRSLTVTIPMVFALGFGLVIAYTMKFRGTGFRLLGSGLWGGGRYVDIMLGLGLFITADTIRLSLRQWRVALVGMVAVGAFPALAEILFVYTKSATGFLYYVFQPLGRIGTAMQRMESGRMVRFTMMLQVSHIYLIPFIVRKMGSNLRLRSFFFPMLAIVLGGFSGHRMVLLNVVLYIWMYFFLSSKRRFAYFIISAVLASSSLFVMGQLAVIFPAVIQRMLTIIPFSNTSPDVMAEAGGTISWRILLWKETLPEIPKYLWLGKGFAYSGELELAHDVKLWANYVVWWAKVQSAYHQGILSLLVGLGLPGLLTGSAFLISLCIRHYRLWKLKKVAPSLAEMHYAVLVLLVVDVVVYFFVYGDVFISFPPIFLIGAIAEGIYRSGRMENESEEKEGDHGFPTRETPAGHGG